MFCLFFSDHHPRVTPQWKMSCSRDDHVRQRKRIPQTWSLLPWPYMLHRQMLRMMGTRCQIFEWRLSAVRESQKKPLTGLSLSLSLSLLSVSGFFLSSMPHMLLPHKPSLINSHTLSSGFRLISDETAPRSPLSFPLFLLSISLPTKPQTLFLV